MDATAEAAKLDAFFSRALDFLPTTQYLNSDKRQQLAQMKLSKAKGGKSRKRLRTVKYHPDFADSSKVLEMLGSDSEEVQEPKKKKARLHGALTPDELKQKLEQKIEAMRVARKAKPSEVSSKQKKAERKREAKLKKKLKVKQMKASTDKPQKSSETTAQPQTPKPVFNKDGKMLYSKFDLIANDEMIGLEGDRSASKKKHLEAKKVFSGKNKKAILRKLEKQKSHLEQLKTSQPAKAQKLEQKIKWQKAIAKAEGIKVKDDPEKLKKSIKKEEKLKGKRKAKWQQRVETVQQKVTEKQQKRQANIQARKDAKVKKKIAKGKKKGHILPELHSNT